MAIDAGILSKRETPKKKVQNCFGSGVHMLVWPDENDVNGMSSALCDFHKWQHQGSVDPLSKTNIRSFGIIQGIPSYGGD